MAMDSFWLECWVDLGRGWWAGGREDYCDRNAGWTLRRVGGWEAIPLIELQNPRFPFEHEDIHVFPMRIDLGLEFSSHELTGRLLHPSWHLRNNYYDVHVAIHTFSPPLWVCI